MRCPDTSRLPASGSLQPLENSVLCITRLLNRILDPMSYFIAVLAPPLIGVGVERNPASLHLKRQDAPLLVRNEEIAFPSTSFPNLSVPSQGLE